MLIALFGDIHANREAFTACLDDARRVGVDRYVFLGDLVGYGADPVWVVERVANMFDAGAVGVRGNHDAGALDPSESMAKLARTAIEWTRAQLGDAHRAFLARLPITLTEVDRLYVHASAAAPESWIYVRSAREAFQSFRATDQRLTFCGHTHIPTLFNETATSLPQQHEPADDKPIPLLAQRRWLAVIGAIGQPRDGNPDACYGLFDDASNTLTYVRVPYDVDIAARKIRAAGLPAALADRLTLGV